MVEVRVRHGLVRGRHFSRNLFCDAMLTKDGVALLPVHRWPGLVRKYFVPCGKEIGLRNLLARALLAAVSTKFRRLFEAAGGAAVVVPVVDLPTLKVHLHLHLHLQLSPAPAPAPTLRPW